MRLTCLATNRTWQHVASSPSLTESRAFSWFQVWSTGSLKESLFELQGRKKPCARIFCGDGYGARFQT